ncbi:MAG: trypsin-like peptidase domain-containing protein [Gammaproteobacteria bacterium]|jgi:serine protease DegS
MQRGLLILRFLFQSAILGLAAAFVAVYFDPALLNGATTEAPPAGPASYAIAVRRSAPAVVNIQAAGRQSARQPFSGGDWPGRGGLPRPNAPPTESLGCGVIVSNDGYILTNYHVVQDAQKIRVGLQDGRVTHARVMGIDADTDLALLKVDLHDLPTIPMGRSDSIEVGDVVLAIGNPYGVGQTVTQGIVSAKGRNQLGLATFENFIQTDAAINAGNSGGALVNARGDLVGINTALMSPSGRSDGIGFAIPVNLARGVMTELVKYGRVIRGWLGLVTQDLTPQLAEAFGLADTQGFVVSRVIPDGPAAHADIRAGDIVVSLNGRAVKNGRDALNRVASMKPGEHLRIGLIRGNRALQREAVVAERPQERQN